LSLQIFGRRVAKLFEYASARGEPLQDIELVADAATLRRLAGFLADTAAQMEAQGKGFEHAHLLDVWSAHGSGVPDIVISRE
jgi:hypothetical protein